MFHTDRNQVAAADRRGEYAGQRRCWIPAALFHRAEVGHRRPGRGIEVALLVGSEPDRGREDGTGTEQILLGHAAIGAGTDKMDVAVLGVGKTEGQRCNRRPVDNPAHEHVGSIAAGVADSRLATMDS